MLPKPYVPADGHLSARSQTHRLRGRFIPMSTHHLFYKVLIVMGTLLAAVTGHPFRKGLASFIAFKTSLQDELRGSTLLDGRRMAAQQEHVFCGWPDKR